MKGGCNVDAEAHTDGIAEVEAVGDVDRVRVQELVGGDTTRSKGYRRAPR